VSLNPNRWTEETITDLAVADDFSEALDSLTIRAGWHDDPATGDSLLIDEETIGVNQFGQLVRRDVKRFTYDVPGTPPLFYSRDTYARPYLPSVNEGRGTILVESERAEYHPWTLFQQGSPNLSRKRLLSGYVVYDLTKRGTALTQAERDELEAKGINPDGNPEIVVASARLWSEANHLAETVESATAPQLAKWVDPVESEFEIVFEEPDKYTIYSYRKNHLRPQDMKVSGPTHQRKPGYTYRLPVAIEPPDIEATVEGDAGVRLDVTGGGATVLKRRVQPERYRILRKTVSSPDPPDDPDPFGLYDTPPDATTKSTLWIDTAVTDLDGTPTSPLPSATPYTEPGDVSEPAGDDWSVVAELDNAQPAEPVGFATFLDDDVVSTAVYEYVATAIIGSDESAPSSPARIQYGGATTSSRITTHVRRTDDGGLELDILAPNPDLYGETIEFEIPVEIYEADAEEFGDEIGRRHFADDLESGLNVDLEIDVPLAILERGQRIIPPAIEWTTTGNGLVITSETESREWILDGFHLSASMDDAGEITVDGTTLYLTER
jgi:hypothetical protein